MDRSGAHIKTITLVFIFRTDLADNLREGDGF